MRDRGTTYWPNGAGRDTYIYNNNGGFCKMKEPRPQFHPGSIIDSQFAAAQRRKDKFPHLHSRPVNYIEDGSGRDSYIITGNGGLQRHSGKGKEYREAFKDSLRGWERNDWYLI